MGGEKSLQLLEKSDAIVCATEIMVTVREFDIPERLILSLFQSLGHVTGLFDQHLSVLGSMDE
jgi:hypothetical protein